MPPRKALQPKPECRKIWATMVLMVVLPCVPAIQILNDDLRYFTQAKRCVLLPHNWFMQIIIQLFVVFRNCRSINNQLCIFIKQIDAIIIMNLYSLTSPSASLKWLQFYRNHLQKHFCSNNIWPGRSFLCPLSQ
jgi:hypothetical protein